MQKLKSFGCSFTFGTDLHDAVSSIEIQKCSQYTWPALLAKDLNLTYSCHARGAAGNLAILNSILQSLVTEKEESLYVIGWTWIDRFNYRPINPLHDGDWEDILPGKTDAVSKFYYKHIHSQYQDKLLSLIYINTAINALKQKKQRYIMTTMDSLIFEKKWYSGLAIKELQNCLPDNITMFDGLTFLEWSRKNNYPISATWHPLEAAHQAAFEYIKNLNLV